MQNVIIAKVNRDVPDALYARFILSFFVGEKDTIPPLQVTSRHVFALLDLRAGVYVQNFPRAFIKHVLYQGRAIEFLGGKAL